jgi:hypothetical protein
MRRLKNKEGISGILNKHWGLFILLRISQMKLLNLLKDMHMVIASEIGAEKEYCGVSKRVV